MTSTLNEYDKALHNEIHAQMLKADPSLLLSNPRLKVIERVKQVIGNIDGVVADVGCGSGYFSIGLLKSFNKIKRVDAIEASQPAVDQVIPRNISHHAFQERIKPKLGSFDSLPIGEYDAVFAMGALHHSTNLLKTLESIASSLKEGGYLVAQEPAMPDMTSHSEYAFKYNIVEERFGLNIRNGDRYDRFFRECEYKSALCHAGFDIIIWEDFLVGNKNLFGFSRLIALLAHIKMHGFRKTMNKIFQKITTTNRVGKNQDNGSGGVASKDWKKDLAVATSSVRPKLMIVRKSAQKEIYHAD